jgi:hypothetical protein
MNNLKSGCVSGFAIIGVYGDSASDAAGIKLTNAIGKNTVSDCRLIENNCGGVGGVIICRGVGAFIDNCLFSAVLLASAGVLAARKKK